MNRFKFLLMLAALAILATSLGCSKEQHIHFDGYYSNVKELNKTIVNFRFYPDGTVTAALPPVAANGVYKFNANELDKSKKECTVRGTYTLKDNKVVFKLLDSHGSADFSGEFRPGKLALKSHSNINGNDGYDSYDFYQVASAK